MVWFPEDPVSWDDTFLENISEYFVSPQNWNSYSYTLNNPINLVDPTGEAAIAAAPAIVFVFSGPVWLFLWGAALVGWVIAMALSPSSNKANNTNNQPQTQATTGAWQTSQWSTAQTQSVSITASPPPSWWGGKDNKPNQSRWSNNNSSTNKDYDKIAKDRWMTKVPNTTSHGRPVYKWPDGKYYSPEKTAHNTTQGWKVWTMRNNQFFRQSTVDRDLKITWK
jgi:hypothetical protein